MIPYFVVGLFVLLVTGYIIFLQKCVDTLKQDKRRLEVELVYMYRDYEEIKNKLRDSKLTNGNIHN